MWVYCRQQAYAVAATLPGDLNIEITTYLKPLQYLTLNSRDLQKIQVSRMHLKQPVLFLPFQP